MRQAEMQIDHYYNRSVWDSFNGDAVKSSGYLYIHSSKAFTPSVKTKGKNTPVASLRTCDVIKFMTKKAWQLRKV